MFDTHSDYALNKADKNAIVCPSVTGEHIRFPVRKSFCTGKIGLTMTSTKSRMTASMTAVA